MQGEKMYLKEQPCEGSNIRVNLRGRHPAPLTNPLSYSSFPTDKLMSATPWREKEGCSTAH